MKKKDLMKRYLNIFSVDKLDFTKKFEVSTKEIDKMMDELQIAENVFHPSEFWLTLAKEHVEKLKKYGFDNFKRTLNMQYFHFPPFPDKSFLRLLLKWIQHPSLNIFPTSSPKLGITEYSEHYISLDGILGIYYSIYVKMLYEITKKIDKKNLLVKLEEPFLGNPIKIQYENKTISFDVCNSLLEYYSINEGMDLWKQNKLVISELGAGYGRLAYVFLMIHPNHKYVIFDIPPTLYISQTYLSKLFPNLKIFKFRHFSSFSEIQKEYYESDVCFFTPNQLEMFPEKEIDVFINISSLHEMRFDQIQKFYQLIDAKTKGIFFTKQYPDIIKLSNGLSGAYEVPFNKYPTPPNWKLIFNRQNEINPRFTEAIYQIGSN
jgi:putative sugar O-methyltransferase